LIHQLTNGKKYAEVFEAKEKADFEARTSYIEN